MTTCAFSLKNAIYSYTPTTMANLIWVSYFHAGFISCSVFMIARMVAIKCKFYYLLEECKGWHILSAQRVAPIGADFMGYLSIKIASLG